MLLNNSIFLAIKRCLLKRLLRYCALCLCAVFISGHVISIAGVVDSLDEYKISVNKALPDGWTIAETKTNVLPDGHYWGMDYEGLKGIKLMLTGINDVSLDWKDENDVWHKSPVAKESISLWIMPIEYKMSWKRFFVFHRPIAAEMIFSTNKIKVYGSSGHRVIDNKAFNEIIAKAKSTKWSVSPANDGNMSWNNWKTAIQAALSK